TIAYRTIERMIREQELEHRALRFLDLFTLRSDYHAVGANDRAGGLELRHLFDANEAHATRSLQSQIGVITERGNIELVFAAHVDHPRAFGDLKVATVDGYFDEFTRH